MYGNSNLSNLMTLDMIYHPALGKIYHVFQYLIFVFSTFTTSFAIHVVIKKSTKEMWLYKYILLNQLIWSYLVELAITIWQPVQLFPFFMCYSAGIAQIFGPMGVYSMFCMTFFALGGMIQSMYVALFFRVARLYPNFWFESKKLWFKVAVAMLVFVETMLFSKL